MHKARSRLSAASAAIVALMAAVSGARADDPPRYKDTKLPFEERVADLVSRMTLEEKADQMQVNVLANARLGIPACRWGTEALHGVPGGTVFPDAMALGATWDPDTVKRVAGAIADEARAHAAPGGAQGVILWCPTVNMARDPRWGRDEETYGEDPYLTARLGAAYVLGLQGDDPKYLKTVATPKHFVVYSQETSRQSVNARVSERALREYYLPAFEACFTEGHAMSVMSAYNAINGIPCSANPWLLTNVLRDEWGFTGAVVTDSRAVSLIYSAHGYTRSEQDAVAAAINAGVDVITDAGPMVNRAAPLITTAVKAGQIKEERINEAVTRALLVRFKVGHFDPPDMLPFPRLANAATIKEHVDLALQAARESITLLKNDPAPRGYGFDRLLPLDPRRIGSIAVIGPYANLNQYGSYTNQNPNAMLIGGTRGPTPLDALRTALGDRITVRAADYNDTEGAAQIAAACDLTIFVGGLNNRIERSGIDRPTLDLPLDQRAALERIVRANPMTILILQGGSAIGLEWEKDHVPAIVMSWYGGEQGGVALAEMLTGQTNPAGRLPMTFYKSVADLPMMDDYELITGRTYLYCKKPVSFPFGHGLSYTHFDYSHLTASPTEGDKTVEVAVDVANAGDRAGDEVVQLYAREVNPKITRPIKQLVGFHRVNIARGQSKTVQFSVPVSGLAFWDTASHRFAVNPGAYEFMVGASSEDIRGRVTVELDEVR